MFWISVSNGRNSYQILVDVAGVSILMISHYTSVRLHRTSSAISFWPHFEKGVEPHVARKPRRKIQINCSFFASLIYALQQPTNCEWRCWRFLYPIRLPGVFQKIYVVRLLQPFLEGYAAECPISNTLQGGRNILPSPEPCKIPR